MWHMIYIFFWIFFWLGIIVSSFIIVGYVWQIFRSSRPEVFCKKGALKNFAKFTGKHLCQSLFFNKVAGLSRFSGEGGLEWLFDKILALHHHLLSSSSTVSFRKMFESITVFNVLQENQWFIKFVTVVLSC